jgi:hypothetical protein
MVVNDTGGECAACGATALKTVEAYSVAEPFFRGVRQGLWLESLASDVLQSRTDTVWTGQMVGTNEIDVMGVTADRTILIECKDTSFGQNDLYVTAIKAGQVEADEVVVVSTRELHQNVMSQIQKIGRDSGVREFSVVTETTASAIEQELTRVLDGFRRQQLADWISGHDDSEIPF